MIIFGMGSKHKKIGEGDFYCPHCRGRQYYFHKKAKRYFTLYFIPLIPLNDLGEFIECQTCKSTFSMEVLSLKTPPAPPRNLAQIMNHVAADLQHGTPVEYLIRDLTRAGLDLDIAMKTLAPYLANGKKVCAGCGLTYTQDAVKCVGCGKELG
jgi:zinc-ribbon family